MLFCIRVGLNPYKQRPRTRCAEINSKLIDVTLSTSGWSGSSAPYSYTISNSNILSTTKVIEIAPTETASNAQIIAFMNASLCGGDISTGKVIIKAFGVKPTTNIPILMVVRGTM